MVCKHTLKEGIQCGLIPGHSGVHVCVQLSGTYMKVNRWNNNRETSPKERGNSFVCNYNIGADCREHVVDLAIMDAARTLGPNVVFEIRGKVQRDENWAIAWYVVTNAAVGFEFCETAKEPIFRVETAKAEVVKEGGYRLIARLST